MRTFFFLGVNTDCSCAYRIVRHSIIVLYHSTAKSEKETSQLAAGYGSCVVRTMSCPTSSDFEFTIIITKRSLDKQGAYSIINGNIKGALS